ncbi:MAG: exodeoxyribonuclease VII small subunit [Alloprevotella sp.]
MPSKTTTYEQKMQQLEDMVTQIESHSLPLDQLVTTLKAALKLADDCDKELKRIETDTNRLLQHEQEQTL